MKYDDILLEIGEFGPYQKRMFYLISIPILITGAQTMGWIFMYDIPAFRCAIPDYPNDTYKIQNEAHAWLVNKTIPPAGELDEGVYSGCHIYTDASSNDSNNNNNSLLSAYDEVNGSLSTASNYANRGCNRRVYDKTDYESTMFSEFDFVCGNEIMRSHINVIDFCGAIVGSLFIGVIADVFGRKSALLLGIVMQVASALIISLVQNFYVILVATFFNGLSSHTIFIIPATTGLELVGPNKRSFAGAVTQLYWSAGGLLLLPIAYLCRQWRSIELAIAVMSVPLFVLWWFVPEAPRWLLEKKRYSEVEEILKKMCNSNNCKLPEGAVTEDTNDEGPRVSIRSFLTNKVIVVRYVVICFNWLAMAILYYGLSLNTYNLEGSPYINYLIGVLVETGGYLICLLFMNKFPRRIFHCAAMIVGGIGCLGVIPSTLMGGDAWIATALSMVGRLSSSCVYTVIYVMSTEMFPTVVRNSALGVCGMFESLGGALCPYIVDIGILLPGPLGSSLPMAIFGGLGLLAGFTSLLLPETRGREMPETIQDAIDFGKKRSSKQQSAEKEYEMVPTTSPDKS